MRQNNPLPKSDRMKEPMTMKTILIAAALTAAVTAMAPASAATYVLNYTGTSGEPLPTTATLKITTANTLNLSGGYDILSASGTVNGVAITDLAALNPAGFNTDNIFFAADPHVSNSGFGWNAPGVTGNLFSNGPGSYSLYQFDGGNYTIATDGLLSVSQVPEPASWALLVIGFGMVGGFARRRQQAVAA